MDSFAHIVINGRAFTGIEVYPNDTGRPQGVSPEDGVRLAVMESYGDIPVRVALRICMMATSSSTM